MVWCEDSVYTVSIYISSSGYRTHYKFGIYYASSYVTQELSVPLESSQLWIKWIEPPSDSSSLYRIEKSRKRLSVLWDTVYWLVMCRNKFDDKFPFSKLNHRSTKSPLSISWWSHCSDVSTFDCQAFGVSDPQLWNSFLLFIFKIHQACNRFTINILKIHYIVSRKRLKGLSLVLAGSWI